MAILYSFPQVAPAVRPPAGETGIASITHGGRTLRFRTNPNEFNWSYSINKRIDQTYGGRVVQLLGTKIDDFTLKADAGGGGWPYLNRVALFLRDVMVAQRNGVPATFSYTTRGWKLNCYIASMPFQDEVTAVAREFEIVMKVQEDLSGTVSRGLLRAELAWLADGVGFHRNQYNDPLLGPGVADQESGGLEQLINAATQSLGGVGKTLQGIGEVLGYASDLNFLPPGFGGMVNPGGGFPGGGTYPGGLSIPAL